MALSRLQVISATPLVKINTIDAAPIHEENIFTDNGFHATVTVTKTSWLQRFKSINGAYQVTYNA